MFVKIFWSLGEQLGNTIKYYVDECLVTSSESSIAVVSKSCYAGIIQDGSFYFQKKLQKFKNHKIFIQLNIIFLFHHFNSLKAENLSQGKVSSEIFKFKYRSFAFTPSGTEIQKLSFKISLCLTSDDGSR